MWHNQRKGNAGSPLLQRKDKVLLFRKKYVLLLVLALCGCGFEPLYVEKKHDNMWYYGGDFDTSISQEMAQISIEPISQRFGQIMRNELIDLLTPKGTPKSPKYRLFVHLTENQRHLRFLQFVIIHFRKIPVTFLHAFLECFAVADNAGFDHFAQQVVTFTGTFTYSGKYRESIMFLGDIIDKFLDQYGFSHTEISIKTEYRPCLCLLRHPFSNFICFVRRICFINLNFSF